LSLSEDVDGFVDPPRARELIERGRAAISNDDGEDLRKVVVALWELQPKSKADATRDSAILAGLRK
jgi:hypothetical protein